MHNILQQRLSSWGNLARECVQVGCSEFAPQILVTLQVVYFKLDVDGQIRGIHGEWQVKNFDVSLQFTKNLKALLRLLQQSHYFIFEKLLGRAHIFQGRKVSSIIIGELRLS